MSRASGPERHHQAQPSPDKPSAEAAAELQARLRRIAHMFQPHKDSALMRDLCRLAIVFAQEGLIRE